MGNTHCSLPWQIVNGTVNNTVGYVTQYGNYILNALRNDALRCGPLSNIYVGTMNLVCRQTVNSMVSDIYLCMYVCAPVHFCTFMCVCMFNCMYACVCDGTYVCTYIMVLGLHAVL